MNDLPQLKFKKLYPEAQIPRRWTPDAVGLDVHAYLVSETGRLLKATIPPSSTRNIGTGLLIEPPRGYYVSVVPRSGLGVHSITVTNSPGTIDPDYRGELKVLVYNGGIENVYIEHGMRIAQLILMPVFRYEIVEAAELSPTERGDRGFGSTGQ